jgi:hypothetical protein
LERFGCALVDEGSKHSKYVNLADPRRVTTVTDSENSFLPVHFDVSEIAETWKRPAGEACQTRSKPASPTPPAFALEPSDRKRVSICRFTPS